MEKTMKAVVKTHEMGAGAELRTVPIPQVGQGDVLVKVESARGLNWPARRATLKFY